MPLVAETLVAIARAEFPKRRIPWRTVARSRTRAGGNQPTLYHFLQETVRYEALAVDAAQLVRPEHTPASLLEHPQRSEGFCEFFVWYCHYVSFMEFSQVYCDVLLQVDNAVYMQVNHVVRIQVYYVIVSKFNRLREILALVRRIPKGIMVNDPCN